MLPVAGDILHIGRDASVQFGSRPFFFRVIRIHPWETYVGWVWLDGYELNTAGDAVERRSIFVQISGLRAVERTVDARTRNGTRRVPVPQQGRNAGAPHRTGPLTQQRQVPNR